MLTKDLIPIREVSSLFPRSPSQQTIWRWTTKGVRGVLLKSLVVGATRYTCPAWIDEFVQQQNASSTLASGGN